MGWLAILKGAIGPLILVAALTYCVTLWVKNSDLTTANANAAKANAKFEISNKALADQLATERLTHAFVNDIVYKTDAETIAVEPIYRERIVYVEKYRNDPNIAKCKLAPEWVSAHNAAATNPYGVSKTGSTP